MSSKAAKILYTPFGTVGGIAAGAVASAVFGKVWKAVRHEDVPPTPRARDRGMGEVVLAAVLQGAIFTGTRAAFDRYAAGVFARWAGEWPDDSKKPKNWPPQIGVANAAHVTRSPDHFGGLVSRRAPGSGVR